MDKPLIVIDDGLVERVKSIRNQCDMFLMLCNLNDADRVIATLLEDLHARSQLILDEYCTEEGMPLMSHCVDNPYDCGEE